MQNSSFAGTRRGLLITLFILGLVTALVLLPTQFSSEAVEKGEGLFTRTVSHDDGLEPMWDIREQVKSGSSPIDLFEHWRNSVSRSAASVADVREGFVRGEAELKARLPHA